MHTRTGIASVLRVPLFCIASFPCCSSLPTVLHLATAQHTWLCQILGDVAVLTTWRGCGSGYVVSSREVVVRSLACGRSVARVGSTIVSDTAMGACYAKSGMPAGVRCESWSRHWRVSPYLWWRRENEWLPCCPCGASLLCLLFGVCSRLHANGQVAAAVQYSIQFSCACVRKLGLG